MLWLFANRSRRLLATVGMLICPLAVSAERSAAELLPATSIAFLQIPSTAQVLNTLWDHPLRQQIESLDQVKAALETKQFLDFKLGVALLESQLGLPWRKMLTQAVGAEAAIAVDARSQGVVLLLRANDPETQRKLIGALVNLIQLDAKNKGTPDPVKSVEYRGLKAYALGEAKLVSLDEWLLVTNQDALAKAIADRYLDRATDNLASKPTFLQARATASRDGVAWGWADLGAFRSAGVAKALYGGKAENALAEILFGGILSTLRNTPFLTVELQAKKDRATLTVSAPHERAWAGDAREYYFGPNGTGTAPPAIESKNGLLSLRAYRDLSGMWQRGGELLDEQANEELDKADSVLSTLFAGKDFGDDILGSFAPEMQLLVVRQEFLDGQPRPAIKLPAFAFLFQLKDPLQMQPELRRTFQSLIGFLNVVGAMNGQPQLDLDVEKDEKVQLITATYLVDAKEKDPTALRINYNFSPSVAFLGSKMVIASTKELARELAVQVGTEKKLAALPVAIPPGDPRAGEQTNTEVTLQLDLVRAALADNRGQLVAQNMLEEGHTKEEAERAVDTLLELVGWFEAASVRLGTTEKDLKLTVSVSIDPRSP